MAQAKNNSENVDGLLERYGDKVNARDFDGNPKIVSELDALIAYLQVLGTLVDFNDYEASLEK
jgi:cytochrome c oxidase cbb3-type subunit 2